MSAKDIRILIMDRNPHVREFLSREFLLLGYEVEIARDWNGVFQALKGPKPPRLVILDPDTPGSPGAELLERLTREHPEIPVIAHMFPAEDENDPRLKGLAALVEKSGRIEKLKQAASSILEAEKDME